MSSAHTLSTSEVREIGEALYGRIWQAAMAKALGVPRQSVGYYLKAGGVSGAQAAAIIGLVARTAARERRSAEAERAVQAERQTSLAELLLRLEAR